MTTAQQLSGDRSTSRLAAGAAPTGRRGSGTPTAPPDPPAVADADIEAAVGVLRSGVIAGPHHPEVLRFEALLAQQSAVRHAVAVNSGTAALHCILSALGIGAGDEVIVPAHTFIATATSVLMAGATPVVVDIDPATYCIDPAAVSAALSPRTRAVIAVHLNGHPAPIDQLPTEIPVIGDACQAHGARLFGSPVGALGAASAFSFWQDKLITAAGEGGAVLTQREDLAAHVRLLRSHGQQAIDGGPDSHHVVLGYNYRLTGVQAAIGHSQLGRLSEAVVNRRHRAGRLALMLADLPGITVPKTRAGAEHVFWKFVLDVDGDAFRDGRVGLQRALAAEKVAAAPRYPIPLTRQPVLVGTARMCPCPVSESLAGRLMTLPLPASDAEVEQLADVTRRVVLAQRR
jgi:perosamine synthetase